MEVTKKYRIPDFFLVGAAKSGTTSLWEMLGNHPDIFMTQDIANKELGFFCEDYGVESIERYSSYFEKALSNQLIGEVCHAYLSSPESATQINSANPNSKIILILRNPYDRLLSLYQWMVENGYEPLSLNEALLRETSGLDKTISQRRYYHSYFRNYLYVQSGLYFEQVSSFVKLFPSHQVRIFLFEDLKDSVKLQGDLTAFLGLSNFAASDLQIANRSKAKKNPRLHFFANNTLYDRLRFLRIPQKLIKCIISRINRLNDSRNPVFLPKEVRGVFDRDIQATSTLIGRDLSHWIYD